MELTLQAIGKKVGAQTWLYPMDLALHSGAVTVLLGATQAGKTSLILETVKRLKDEIRIAAIEGDLASTVDTDKVKAGGVPAVQINTGGGCHLDANQVAKSLSDLPMDDLDLVFIENVGNLICPVSFDLGQDYRVALLSVPEGHDKPYKYPAIFEAVDVVVVTKTDLMPYLDFDLPKFTELVWGLNPAASVLPLSAKTGEGMAAWLAWVEARLG